MVFTERRSFKRKRITANIDARFFYGNMFYSGTVLNLSEKGMFINTRRCLPFEPMFVVIIRIENELLNVIAKVKRITKLNTDCDGMGVELLSPSNGYLELIKRLKITWHLK